MTHDLTVVMPVFDGSDTIQKALKSLIPQGLNLRIIIADNGSQDGTPEMLKKAIANKYYGTFDVELHEVGRVQGQRRENIAHVRKFLAEKAETKFLFWMDDDIKLPAFALKLMLELAISSPKLGVVGLHYQPFNGHMAVGATMMPTELAKKLTWAYLQGQPCECAGALEEIKKMNFEVMFMQKITALDLNYL